MLSPEELVAATAQLRPGVTQLMRDLRSMGTADPRATAKSIFADSSQQVRIKARLGIDSLGEPDFNQIVDHCAAHL